MGTSITNKNIYRFVLFAACTVICISIFFPFITTVGVAVIFALVLDPAVKKIQHTQILGFSLGGRKMSTALLLLFLINLFILPFIIMSTKIYSHYIAFSETDAAKQVFVLKLSQYMVRLEDSVFRFIGRFGLMRRNINDDASSEIAQKTANYLLDGTTYILGQIPSLITAMLIFLIALYYLLAEAEKIKTFFNQLGLFSFREINIIGESLRTSSFSAVVSTIMAGIIHGLIVAIGVSSMGAGDFSFVFMLTFFLSFVPVLGATIIALGLCVPALVEQNYSNAMIFLGIAILASAIDNIVRPFFLVYGNSLIHPFIALLSILGGIYVLGMAGLFIGPVLVQVTIESLPKLVRLAPNPKASHLKKHFDTEILRRKTDLFERN